MAKLLNLVFLAFALFALFSTIAFAEPAPAAVAAEKKDAVAAPAAAEKKEVAAAPAAAEKKEVAAAPAAAAADGAAAKVRAPRSLLQACRKEINKVCPEKKAIVKCLSTKVDKIEDPECKTWIIARDVCTKAASKNSKCTAKDSPRQCLRKVNASELPEECTNSEFYKSVKMFSMFRKNPGKSGLLGKLKGGN